jgi:hypothetical protein
VTVSALGPPWSPTEIQPGQIHTTLNQGIAQVVRLGAAAKVARVAAGRIVTLVQQNLVADLF